MEPLGSIGSIPPKAAGSSHPAASTGKTVMLLSAKLGENGRGKQRLFASPHGEGSSWPGRGEGACRGPPSPWHGCGAEPSGCWSDAWWALGPAHHLPVQGWPPVPLWSLDSRLPGQGRTGGEEGLGLGGRCAAFRRFPTSRWSSSRRGSAATGPGFILVCSVTLHETRVISHISFICGVGGALCAVSLARL